MQKRYFFIFLLYLAQSQASISFYSQFIQQESTLPTGIYFGTDLGYAWINGPLKNDKDLDFLDTEKGHFAWGIYGGYQLNLVNILSAGFEIGYHDNGFSTFTFDSGNRYRLRSKDWSFLLTIFYPLSKNAFIYVKGGGARVWQINEIVKNVDDNEVIPRYKNKRWVPTATIGCTTSLCGWIYPFLHYRVIFGKDLSKFSSCKKFEDPATVSSIFSGMMINF